MRIGNVRRRSAGFRGLISVISGLALSAAIAACSAFAPEKYDHASANMIVRHTSVAGVARRCGRHMPAHRAQILGCALGNEKLCLVFLPHKASVGAVAYERLYRHERAHCNGWKH